MHADDRIARLREIVTVTLTAKDVAALAWNAATLDDAARILDAWRINIIEDVNSSAERCDRRIAENDKQLAAFLGRRGFTDDDTA